MNIFLTFSEFLWALIGNIWVVKGLLSQCIKPGDVKITDIPLYAILGIIVTTWIGLILKVRTGGFNFVREKKVNQLVFFNILLQVILSCLSFNSIESRDSQGNNEPFVMEQNKSMISKLFSKCCKPTTSNVFQVGWKETKRKATDFHKNVIYSVSYHIRKSPPSWPTFSTTETLSPRTSPPPSSFSTRGKAIGSRGSCCQAQPPTWSGFLPKGRGKWPRKPNRLTTPVCPDVTVSG